LTFLVAVQISQSHSGFGFWHDWLHNAGSVAKASSSVNLFVQLPVDCSARFRRSSEDVRLSAGNRDFFWLVVYA
jgi:hypothetical protein